MYINNLQSVFAVFAAVIGLISVFAAVMGLVLYIFQAIGLYSIGKRRIPGTSGFAWIPILNVFKMGQIADDAVYHKRGTRSHFVVLMPVFYIAGVVLSGIGIFLQIISLNINIQVSDPSRIFGEVPYLIESGTVSQGTLTAGVILLVVGYVLVLIATVLEYVCLYHIFKSCSTSYVAFFVLSLIFAVTIPFFLFAVRKNDNPDYYFETPPVPDSLGE